MTTLLYLITRLDYLNIFFGFFSFLLTVITFIVTIAYCFDRVSSYANKETVIYTKEILKKILYPVSIVFWLLCLATPTSKEAAFIVLAPQIIENGAIKETVKNIPELTALGTQYLKELLKEKVNDSNN